MDQAQERNIALGTIIVPIGNGTLLSSIWRGMQEMKKAKLLKQRPKIIGVQAAGCAPVYKAWLQYKKKKKIELQIIKPKTIATAIACGDPSDGDKAIMAVIESGGSILTVSDKEILHARNYLAQHEGLDVEPSGAVSFAGWKKLGTKPRNAVCILTGHGLKDIENA